MTKKTLYKIAKAYYQGAYRARIKSLNPTWNNAQITSTLHWMWANVATQAEKDECERLRREKSADNPFAADDSRIPDTPKTTDDPAPPATAEPATDVTADDRTFSYLPHMSDVHTELPAFPPKEGNLSKAEKRTLMEAGLCDPDREPEAKRWHGTHFLGQGTTGVCSHWVRTDDDNIIAEKLAVRDVATVSDFAWTHPMNWRDQLPREIGIIRRLHQQEGYAHSLHRYEGHRIDTNRRRYRIYNEVCDFGNIACALDYYRRPWQFRWAQYVWLKEHPKIREAMEKTVDVEFGVLDAEAIEDNVHETRLEEWQKYDIERPVLLDYRGEELDDMGCIDLELVAMESISKKLPETIPEAFLWQVFDQLADAALLMQRGAEPLLGEKQWKEIVHGDVHLGNIFVKPNKNGSYGTTRDADSKSAENKHATFARSQYPDIVLSDFDIAFFDLQANENDYQDNPSLYRMNDVRPSVAARYPPETLEGYQQRQGPTKLTSATNVWSIGQIMWNLVMQLPLDNRYEAPFFDHETKDYLQNGGRRLNSGEPYTAEQLEGCLLTGHVPFEAAAQYSKPLKDTIRDCLHYDPRARTPIQDLKELTASYREEYSARPESKQDPLVIKLDEKMDRFRIGQRYSPLSEEDDEEE